MFSARSKIKHAVSRTATIVVVVIVIIIIAAAGYFAIASYKGTSPSNSTSSSSSSNFTGTLSIDDAYYPEGYLNPLRVFEVGWPQWTEYTVYQSLVVPNATDEFQKGTIQFLPMLAKNWTVSSNGLNYTFDLRQGVTFSNGDPFNSYEVWAVIYAMYYLSSNSSTFLNSYRLFNMSNVEFGNATLALLAQSGLNNPTGQALNIMQNSSWPIYTRGPYTIVFHLDAPFGYFLGTIITYEGLLFDMQYVLSHGGLGSPTTPNGYFDTNPIPGTGPYSITSLSINSYVKFAQNPTYWGKNLTSAQVAANPYLDPGHVKSVIVNYKPDDLSRYTDLSTGQSQIAAIEASDWNLVLQNLNKYSYFTLPPSSGLTMALALNTKTYPTNITLVRQAIVHAINYTDIIQKVFFGQATQYMGPEYPDWKFLYDLGNFPPYQYNLSLAQQDLSKAGVTNMPNFLFRVAANCQYCINTAQIVQSDLAQLGITVNIEVLTTSQLDQYYGSYTTQLQYADQIGQLALLGDIGFAPNELTPADPWVSYVSNGSLYGNYALYSNPTVQNCVNTILGSNSTSQIVSACTPAQQQIYNDAPYAWLGLMKLWYVGGSLVWDKGVISNFYVDPVFSGANTVPVFNTVTFG
jgi:peptide/nickel transport system substrate-binding protein